MNEEVGQMRGNPKVQRPDYGTIAEMETMDNPQVRTEEIAWLAGMWEGEGSFGLYWHKPRKTLLLRHTIVSTDKEYIERASDIQNRLGIGGYIYDHPPVPSAKKHWKPRIDFIVQGVKRTEKLCEVLLPYMTAGTVKKAKVEIILAYCRSRLAQESRNVPLSDVERRMFQQFNSLCSRPAGKRLGSTSETRCPPSFIQ